MTVRLKDLIPEVRTHLEGAPEPTVIIYLRRAARQFCQDRRVWDVRIGTADISPPVEDERIEIPVPSTGDDPDFTLPADARINRISLAALDDEEDGKLTAKQYRYDFNTEKLIIARGVVMQDAELILHAILEPTDTANSIANVVNRHRMAIIDFAINEMMRMPNKAWTDTKSANDFLRSYTNRLAEATVSQARGGTDEPVEVEPIPFV